jgi:hypothetical protein
MFGAVLGSQLFSGFLIGWMIEHPTKSNSKNPKTLDVYSTLNVKNPKKLIFYWIFIGLLWIEIKKIQSNSII